MNNVEDVKSELLFKIDDAINWRSEKASQYPDDTRNQQCVEALTKLRTALEELPIDHPGIRSLWWAWYRPRTTPTLDLDSVIDTENKFIKNYGFQKPQDGDASDFLRELAEAIRTEADLS